MLSREGSSPTDTSAEPLPASVPDVGRALRRTRGELGLSIEDLSARTGLLPAEIEALESGTVARLPDSVGILQSLRRYADALGLPGDRFVLAVVDHWPTPVTVPPPAYGPLPGESRAVPAAAATAAATAAVAAQSPSAPPPPPPPPASASVGDVRAGDTGAVPAVTGSAPTGGRGPGPGDTFVGGTSNPPTGVYLAGSGTGVREASTPVPLLIADTGVTPAVPSARRGRRSGVTFLRVLVGLVAVLVIVGLAGLAVNQWRPQWLKTLGLPHRSYPAATHTTSTVQHTTSTKPPGKLTLVSHSSNGATFAVRSPTFAVAVVPAGSPSWVQVTDAQHVSPIFSATVGTGQTKTFTASQSLTVQVGATGVRVFVAVDGRPVGFYLPPTAPYTMTFNSVS